MISWNSTLCLWEKLWSVAFSWNRSVNSSTSHAIAKKHKKKRINFVTRVQFQFAWIIQQKISLLAETNLSFNVIDVYYWWEGVESCFVESRNFLECYQQITIKPSIKRSFADLKWTFFTNLQIICLNEAGCDFDREKGKNDLSSSIFFCTTTRTGAMRFNEPEK